MKKKKRTLPEETTCRNCGVQTMGRYCHECGQDVLAGTGQPILKLLGQGLENAFSLDAKAPRTLAYLIIRPGFLPNEYRIGKINSYVHPVKLFWMATIIFFALLISRMDLDNLHERAAAHSNDQTTTSFTLNQADAVDTPKVTIKMGNKTIEEDASTFIYKISKQLGTIINQMPYATFFLMPIFALLLMLFFWRKKYYYLYHLIFAVHFHTFLWIYCSLLLIIDIFTRNVSYSGWLNLLLFLIPGAYLTIAFHKYYQIKSWGRAIWKSVLIGFLYFLLIFIITVLLVFLMLKIFFPELLS